MQAETRFKNKLVPRLKKLPFSWVLKTQEVARSGTPDVLMCLSGIFVCIEIKADSGKVSKLQEYNLNKIKEAGGVALVIAPNNFEASIQFLENLSEEAYGKCTRIKKGIKYDKTKLQDA